MWVKQNKNKQNYKAQSSKKTAYVQEASEFGHDDAEPEMTFPAAIMVDLLDVFHALHTRQVFEVTNPLDGVTACVRANSRFICVRVLMYVCG